jgi:prepilin-type N-terminal cleavage/methylation domain-containing protein
VGRLAETAGGLRRSERGFTLIELLVAASIGMVVLGGAVTVFIGAVRSEPRTASKVTAIQQGRVAVERITRELRQGLEVLEGSTADRLSLLTYVKQTCAGEPAGQSEACLVTYQCAGEACTRTVEAPDESASGPAVQVVSGLSSTDVFTYTPTNEPGYVGVELRFATREGGPVVIADGAALRNDGGES